MSEVPLQGGPKILGIALLQDPRAVRVLIREIRGTSLISNHRSLGPYSRTMPRALLGS
jgi:hypothetical protein